MVRYDTPPAERRSSRRSWASRCTGPAAGSTGSSGRPIGVASFAHEKKKLISTPRYFSFPAGQYVPDCDVPQWLTAAVTFGGRLSSATCWAPATCSPRPDTAPGGPHAKRSPAACGRRRARRRPARTRPTGSSRPPGCNGPDGPASSSVARTSPDADEVTEQLSLAAPARPEAETVVDRVRDTPGPAGSAHHRSPTSVHTAACNSSAAATWLLPCAGLASRWASAAPNPSAAGGERCAAVPAGACVESGFSGVVPCRAGLRSARAMLTGVGPHQGTLKCGRCGSARDVHALCADDRQQP